MTNEVEKFDPSKLMEGVRDRIKATFVSLIPDAQWEQLCQTECERFFNHAIEDGYRTVKSTSFQRMCAETLSEIAKEKIKSALEKYDGRVWENSDIKVTDALLEILKKNASEILASMIGSRVATIINELRTRGY